MTANETAGSECPDTEVASQPPLECSVCARASLLADSSIVQYF